MSCLATRTDESRRRRWDIGEIELTCHNTNTALAAHRSRRRDTGASRRAQRRLSLSDRRATLTRSAPTPNTSTTQAYTILANAVYPWRLPFDLLAAEARRYLAQLGVRRDVLMEHFRREGAAPLPIDVAAEYLGLTPRERSIITGSA